MWVRTAYCSMRTTLLLAAGWPAPVYSLRSAVCPSTSCPVERLPPPDCDPPGPVGVRGGHNWRTCATGPLANVDSAQLIHAAQRRP